MAAAALGLKPLLSQSRPELSAITNGILLALVTSTPAPFAKMAFFFAGEKITTAELETAS